MTPARFTWSVFLLATAHIRITTEPSDRVGDSRPQALVPLPHGHWAQQGALEYAGVHCHQHPESVVALRNTELQTVLSPSGYTTRVHLVCSIDGFAQPHVAAQFCQLWAHHQRKHALNDAVLRGHQLFQYASQLDCAANLRLRVPSVPAQEAGLWEAARRMPLGVYSAHTPSPDFEWARGYQKCTTATRNSESLCTQDVLYERLNPERLDEIIPSTVTSLLSDVTQFSQSLASEQTQ